MLAEFPLYLSFLGTAVALFAAAMAIYLMITPHHEIRLIREGNTACAYSFGGAAIGMAIVLFVTAAGTMDVTELAVWGGIGLVGQLVIYFAASLMIPGLRAGLEADRPAYGILLGALSIAMGLVNAGAISS